MNPSALEAHAEAVARDVAPDEPREGERSAGFLEIITLIIGIFSTLMQNCPQTPQAKAAAVRKPNLRQRAALLKTAMATCQCCGKASLAGPVYRSMLARGSGLSDTDAAALVSESSDDANLLI